MSNLLYNAISHNYNNNKQWGLLVKIGYASVAATSKKLDTQEQALRQAGCEKIYTDKISGTTQQRPELDKMMADLRSGDTLVVWKLDRLGRTTRYLLDIVALLRDRNINFLSLIEPMDITTSDGMCIFTFCAALVEAERDRIRERTITGLQAAKNQGKFGGRKHKLLDKDIAVARTLLLDSNITVAEVAARMKISPATLYRYFPGGRRVGKQQHQLDEL